MQKEVFTAQKIFNDFTVLSKRGASTGVSNPGGSLYTMVERLTTRPQENLYAVRLMEEMSNFGVYMDAGKRVGMLAWCCNRGHRSMVVYEIT